LTSSAQTAESGVFDAANAGQTLLAPNTELAAALFDWVERRHLALGHEIWPTPRIRDFSGWLRERYAERQLLDASLPRCLSDVEERELWRSVILESDGGAELLEPNGAAQSARRARRAVIDYGIPLQKLAEYATEESLAFLDWNKRFEARCRELRCIAPDQLLDSAPTTSGLVWIESPIWRPVVRRWLENNAVAMLLPPRTAAPAAPRVVAASSPTAELAAMAEWAAGHLRASPDFRAWICIPDLNLRRAEVADAFDAVLAPQRFSLTTADVPAPYAVAGGTPLADYPPVRTALAALTATTGSLPFEAFSDLLRMPQMHFSAADAGAAARLDVELRSRGPSEAGFADWLLLAEKLATPKSERVQADLFSEPPAVAVSAVKQLRSFLSALDTARGAHFLSQWVTLWIAAFEAGPWVLRRRWSSTEFQAAERFRELLAALATGDALFGKQGPAAAIRILSRAARDTAFQPQTGIPAVWVSAQIMDPWLIYDGLWVSGCSEERWPPPLDPIALLPVKLQRDYGVIPASIESQLQLAEDLQGRWQLRAGSCVFSCADSSDGRPTAPSPLLPVSSEPASSSPQPHWQAQALHAPPLEVLRDDAAPAFAAAVERTRGVSTLRAQSRCAFRGYAEGRLLTDRLEKPVPGFNLRERGELVHHALEYIWGQLKGSDGLAAMAPEPLEALVANGVSRAIAKQCEQRDPGVRWSRRERPRMMALLNKWLLIERLREPFTVEQLEQGTQIARHGGLDFRVRIDRVDRLLDGGRVLIDYKTGIVSPDWRGDRPDNPQLPVYALLRPESLVAVAYGMVNAAKCGFVAEHARPTVFKPSSRKPSSMEGMPDFPSLIALWSVRIEVIAAEFAAGHAEVAPTLRACSSCNLQPLCRIPSALDDQESADE
jgi:ATP-dependent helicase/nuclease subunit B